jgi:hypothetical protein
MTPAANAHDIDSEHLFGFTSGTDVDAPGEAELEFESEGRFGKRTGSYRALTGGVELKYVPIENFRITGGIGASRHSIVGVPGLDDRNSAGLEGLSLELRRRLLDREKSIVGLTISARPFWSRRDETSGESVRAYGAEFRLMVDKELVHDKVFAAVNLLYTPERSRSLASGISERSSTLGISGAVVAQAAAGVFVGGELRYLRAYDGLALNDFAGHALFAGPVLYVKTSAKTFISVAWSVQVAGRAVGFAGPLDLENFTRHETVFRFGMQF